METKPTTTARPPAIPHFLMLDNGVGGFNTTEITDTDAIEHLYELSSTDVYVDLEVGTLNRWPYTSKTMVPYNIGGNSPQKVEFYFARCTRPECLAYAGTAE